MKETLETIGIIVGLIVCGFITCAFVVTVYISIKDCFKRKILEIVRTEIARQKYLEKQKRNDEYDVQHE